MQIHIDIQQASDWQVPISDDALISWVTLVLSFTKKEGELTLRLVDAAEIQQLNQQYRQKNKPTNVLAFPSKLPQHIALDTPFLGDVLICPAVLAAESLAQQKPLIAHWAHIVMHGVLHLLGYDHINQEDETIMQELEINLLAKLGFANPYLLEDIEID